MFTIYAINDDDVMMMMIDWRAVAGLTTDI